MNCNVWNITNICKIRQTGERDDITIRYFIRLLLSDKALVHSDRLIYTPVKKLRNKK